MPSEKLREKSLELPSLPRHVKCQETGKHPFVSRKEGKLFAKRRSMTRLVHVYLCDQCGYWHFTKSLARGTNLNIPNQQ